MSNIHLYLYIDEQYTPLKTFTFLPLSRYRLVGSLHSVVFFSRYPVTIFVIFIQFVIDCMSGVFGLMKTFSAGRITEPCVTIGGHVDSSV